jgi:hypothetical protein
MQQEQENQECHQVRFRNFRRKRRFRNSIRWGMRNATGTAGSGTASGEG